MKSLKLDQDSVNINIPIMNISVYSSTLNQWVVFFVIYFIWQIGTSFEKNIAEDHRKTDTIFLSWWAILPTENLKWFSDILRELGYTKKTEIISQIEQSSTTVSGEEYSKIQNIGLAKVILILFL